MATRKYALYSVTNNVNNKQYFGVTIDVVRREKEHFGSGKTGSPMIKAAIAKYGKENFEFKVLCFGNMEYIGTLEENAIKAFNSLVPNGYNKCKGGFPKEPVVQVNNLRRTGKKNNDTQKQAAREAQLGKKYPGRGKGRVVTEAQKKHHSEIMTGKTWSDESKDNFRVIQKAIQNEPERKEQQRQRMKLWWAERKAKNNPVQS